MLYVGIFLLSFHLFFVVYMNSSFLSTFINEKYVGLIYVVSAACAVTALVNINKILRRIGNFKLLMTLAVVEFLLFLGLSAFDTAYLIIPLFIIQSTIFPVMLYTFDIFLESYTEDENETGGIRGIVLSLMNTALILGPLIAGFVLTNGDYWKIYFIAAFILIPFIILIQQFRYFRDPDYHHLKLIPTIKCILADRDLINIVMAQFVMRFLYSWLVIYAPIYLHNHVGFSWSEIGVMTAIMLIPLAVNEYPVGILADRYVGEKRLLMLGFFIAGLFVILLSVTTAKDFLYWTGIMFILRVGASFIEILTESYFFKHVTGSDNNTISFFRITRPASFVISPLIGSMVLLFVDIQYMWIVAGLVLFSGIYFSSRITDIHVPIIR
jgi:MFS family permease